MLMAALIKINFSFTEDETDNEFGEEISDEWGIETDMIDTRSGRGSSISELEPLGLKTKLNELNDSYEVENLVENLKQMLFQEYKSMC